MSHKKDARLIRVKHGFYEDQTKTCLTHLANNNYSVIEPVPYRRVAEIQIFEKTYLIVIKDETGLKFKKIDSSLFLIGSYAQKLVASC